MEIWIKKALEYNGEKEIKGPHHNPKILELLDIADGKDDGKNLQGIRDDETPWCASFISGVLEEVSVESARTAWARGYLNWGVKLAKPALGCIVVFERGPTSGHVGFLVGYDKRGNLLILGGNQGDAVSIVPFSKSRVLGYRWPKDHPVSQEKIPVVASAAALSKNEA